MPSFLRQWTSRSSPRSTQLERRHPEVVKAHGRIPVIEPKMLVARPRQGLSVGERQVACTIDAPLQRFPIRPLELDVIRLPRRHRPHAFVVTQRVHVDLLPVVSVLVDARQNVLGVLPPAQDRQVARRIRIAR